MLTELILVRHGETVWNREMRIQGYRDSNLTEAGIAQARAVAVRLAAESFAALICSDLGRAEHTARIISEHTGHAVRAESALRERNYGILEGLTREEFRSRHPVHYERHDSRDADYVIPEGESQRDFVVRIDAALNALADKYAGQRIVVVSHGGVLTAFYRHVSGIAMNAPRTLVLPNASYNVFARRSGKWSVERWGDTGHLDEQDVASEV
jgi:probable phosphoglycerate mutase